MGFNVRSKIERKKTSSVGGYLAKSFLMRDKKSILVDNRHCESEDKDIIKYNQPNVQLCNGFQDVYDGFGNTV